MSQTFKIIPKEKRARKEVERLSVSQFVAYMDGEFDYLTDLVYRRGGACTAHNGGEFCIRERIHH